MNNKTRIFPYITLLLFWILQTLFYAYKHDFTVLSLNDRYSLHNFTTDNKDLLKSSLLHASFRSHFSNLGIIQVRFITFHRSIDDQLIFRLKESGATEWYYQATYNTDQFQHDQLFPFGFPVIEDSANKEYEFEIVSLAGTMGDHVRLSNTFPSFVGKHIFTQNQLTNKEKLITFVKNKLFNSFSDPSILLHSMLYLLPIVVYWHYENYIKIHFSYSITPLIAKNIVVLAIIAETLTEEVSSDIVVVFILLFWGIMVKKHQLKYKVSAQISGYLIILVPLLISINQHKAAENLFEWVFIFFAFSVLQYFFSKIILFFKSSGCTAFVYFSKTQ